MIVKTNIKEAADSLYSSKQRTLLALVGIVIGIGSVIAMVSIGRIVEEEAIGQFKNMGIDILTIRKDSAMGNEAGSRAGLQSPAVAIQLKDVLEMPAYCPGIGSVAPFVTQGGEMYYAGRKLEGDSLLGVTQSFWDMNKLTAKEGRLLSDLDEYSQFCVIGSSVYQKMMKAGGRHVIGEKLRIGDGIFTVVGALKEVPPRGMRQFEANDSVYSHITTALRIGSSAEISTITARVNPDVPHNAAQNQIREYFAKRTKTKNVKVTSPEEMIAQMEKQMQLFTLLLGAIGSISLIVGGVGVMNVMLVSVSERRKEIGIRRALGASRGDIKGQFLIESVILSLIGGALGILLGVGVSFIISFLAGWHFSMSYMAIILGVGVSSGVGIFFGLYPAIQASKLDPIVALRSE